MKILIDGDSCSVIHNTEHIAKQFDIPCHIYCDTNHMLTSLYSDVHIVDHDRDSADFAIVNQCETGDIVITNDSGLAAMVLAKNGTVINSRGFQYTKTNIIGFLNGRYVRTKTKHRTNRNQMRGKLYNQAPKTQNFDELLSQIIAKIYSSNERISITNESTVLC
ncbi:DUF188 domain-containing protein [bacterium]|nr:DUF188 domain-containing protein [bacterium]